VSAEKDEKRAARSTLERAVNSTGVMKTFAL
jgi:hypothetical protein